MGFTIRQLFLSLTLIHSLISISAVAEATLSPQCQSFHKKAISTCAAHEHAVNANSLTIISAETRNRVILGEENKLQGIKASCLKMQRQCALVCDEEVETASLDGLDIATPLERLNDCRQGEVARQIREMNKKLSDLKRVTLPVRSQSIKSAANNP